MTPNGGDDEITVQTRKRHFTLSIPSVHTVDGGGREVQQNARFLRSLGLSLEETFRTIRLYTCGAHVSSNSVDSDQYNINDYEHDQDLLFIYSKPSVI